MTDAEIITFLWDLLDNIDTADDAAKSSDALYRRMARRQQNRRWETGIQTDGYSLWLPDGRPLRESSHKPPEPRLHRPIKDHGEMSDDA